MSIKINKIFLEKTFINLFPESYLKHRMYCIYYNNIQRNNFYVSCNKKYFEVILDNDDVSIKLCDYKGIKFFNELLRGYLKNFTLKKGDVIIDAGAYVGEFTIYAAKKVGETGKVIAFEPDSKNYKQLKENIRLNNLNNVIAINKGLWNENTILRFSKTSQSCTSFFNSKISNDLFEIPVIKLDDELDILNIETVDFIKMDIEGAEIEAIKGCMKTLNHNNVNMAIASYHIVNNNPTYIMLEKQLSEMGFICETNFPVHLTTYASRKKN